MKRLWSRVSVRVMSVGLLVLGVIGGVHLGQGQDDQQRQVGTQLVVQADVDELQLLKERQSQHAAARAWQRQAEGQAAAKAAAEAKAAASRARKLEQKVIAADKAKKAAAAAAAAEKEKQQEEAAESGDDSGSAEAVPVAKSCSSYDEPNKALGCTLMLKAGFAKGQFSCLEKLWDKESGWNHRAENESSGAYGIPQAFPGSKMASAGDDWETNPATQIKWGLDYIAGKYDTPCGAWSHSQAEGWY